MSQILTMKVKNIFSFLCFLCAFIGLQAQPLKSSRPEFNLKAAEEAFAEKDYYNALDLYEKYYDQTKDRAVGYQIAMLQMNLRDYARAEGAFSRVLQREKKAAEGESHPDARFYYAQMQKMNEKYEEAILSFEDFVKESKDEKRIAMANVEIEGAKLAMKMKDNIVLIVNNAGNKVNTPNNEYSPSVAADGSVLYFTSFRNEKMITLDDKAGDYFAKVMKAERSPRGTWQEPEPVGGDINRQGTNHGSVYVTPDGNTMFLTRIELNGNEVVKSTLFSATKQGEAWSIANEVVGINGNFMVKHPCIGEIYGKEVLFFSANMEGTKGGFDLYYASKNPDGTYGAPINLGEPVNTLGDEETPFYKEGKLYFSSNGLPTIGGFDIFSASWNGTTWTTPDNMGKGINSAANDRYFNIDENGAIYLLSNRPGGRSLKSRTCCEDIYILQKEPLKIDLIATTSDGKKQLLGVNYQFIEVSKGKQGKPDEQTVDTYKAELLSNKGYIIITSRKGYISDTTEFNTIGIKENQKIEKKIVLKPVATLMVFLQATAKSGSTPLSKVSYQLTETGGKSPDSKTVDTYSADLNFSKQYVLIGSKAGFISDTVKFSTNDIKETTTIEKVLNLKPKVILVKRNERIKLQNLYYKLDKFAANEEEMENWGLAQQSLDYLYDIMSKYPDMQIELSSHTDSQGSDKYNLELSQKRAEGVKKFLIEKGIERAKIVAKGYGETRLANQCKNGVKCTPDEHLKNRRTEFRILSGPETIEITEQQSATNN
jgi:outer membrane protein OmpA-like peptidoglycan-associated protein/tetratricopeptide (TPR) repeat protein